MKSSTKYLSRFFPLVDAIAATFGSNCEVVLHDLAKPESSIIRIANGSVTGRKVGAPITDLALSMIQKGDSKTESLVGYKSKTSDGKELKCTTVFLKNEKGKTIGTLCINIDITSYIYFHKSLGELFQTSSNTSLNTSPSGSKAQPERFEQTVESLITDMIRQAIEKINKPISHMTKKDKLNMIRDLKDKGLFQFKGSAKKVSEEMNVSLASIYKYLEEIQ